MTPDMHYDHDSRPVPAVAPVYPGDGPDYDERSAIRREVIARMLTLFCDGARNAEAVGRRILTMRHIIHHIPETQVELAELLGITEQAVSRSVESAEAKMQRLSAD